MRRQPGGERIDPERIASAPFPFPYSIPPLRAVKAAGSVAGREAALAYFDGAAAAWFEEARNVADEEVLAAIAEEAGLDRASFSVAMADRAREAEVAADVDQARRLGVSAVPSLVLPDGDVVPGAQTEELYRSVFASLERGRG